MPTTSARVSAFSTYGIQLMMKGTTDYEKVCDIKNVPDLGGEPEQLETTTLSDNIQTYCEGIQSFESLKFDANYLKADYDKIKALFGQTKIFAIYIGNMVDGVSDGADGKFYVKGTINTYIKGAGVNDVLEMTITITPATPISETEPT